MALEAQTRPKRSPERAPTDGERLLEEREAAGGTQQRAAREEEPDDREDFEDDAPPARRAAADTLDDVGRQAVDIEKRARKLGWRPEAEWTGDPGKWSTADEWIEKVLANRPLAEDRFKKLERQNDDLLAQIAESNRRNAEVGQVVLDMAKQQKTIRKREYDRAREDLIAEQRQAVEDGNIAAFDAAEAKKVALEKDNQPTAEERQETQRPDPNTGAGNPVVNRWLAANPWFNNDPLLHQVADAYHLEVKRTQPNLSLGENLAMVREEMVRLYPAKFPGEEPGEGEEDDPPPRRQASAVHRPTGNAGRRERPVNQRGINDLPAADRAIYDRQKKQGVVTEAEFLANYLWEDQDQRR